MIKASRALSVCVSNEQMPCQMGRFSVLEALIRSRLKGTCWVGSVRRKNRKSKHGRRRVRIGAPDKPLTGVAGLAAVDELVLRLVMVAAFDAGVGRIKQRGRGLTAGQLLVGMASGQLVGQDCLAGLDRVRRDAGSALLKQAPVAPSTTAGRLAGAFGPDRLAGIDRRTGRGLPPLADAGPRHRAGAAGAARSDD
jgi:hypothetical protein